MFVLNIFDEVWHCRRPIRRADDRLWCACNWLLLCFQNRYLLFLICFKLHSDWSRKSSNTCSIKCGNMLVARQYTYSLTNISKYMYLWNVLHTYSYTTFSLRLHCAFFRNSDLPFPFPTKWRIHIFAPFVVCCLSVEISLDTHTTVTMCTVFFPHAKAFNSFAKNSLTLNENKPKYNTRIMRFKYCAPEFFRPFKNKMLIHLTQFFSLLRRFYSA